MAARMLHLLDIKRLNYRKGLSLLLYSRITISWTPKGNENLVRKHGYISGVKLKCSTEARKANFGSSYRRIERMSRGFEKSTLQCIFCAALTLLGKDKQLHNYMIQCRYIWKTIQKRRQEASKLSTSWQRQLHDLVPLHLKTIWR